MKNRNESLAKNTVIFAVGSFGSKLLQFILVPFYTRAMTDAEFGVTDLLQGAVSLLLPIFTLTIYESVFRYAMEKETDRKGVFSAGVAVTVAGIGFLAVIAAALTFFTTIEYVPLVAALTAANALRTLLSQYTRAIDRSVLFTVDNLLMTVAVLILNIVFIAVLKLGVEGYMYGYIGANLFSCVFLRIALGREARVKLSRVSKQLLKTLLLYSVPLIPNAICWWLTSYTDRVMITGMVSVGASGLYAAAHKVPSLLSVVVTIFFQAWQISANEEFKKKDIGAFYSEIFRAVSGCVFVISALLTLLCRPITFLLVGEEFHPSWVYMPVLILSMTFFSFAQFLGSIYSANKKTKMAFVTNFIAMLVNAALNYVLISLLGPVGAAAATAFSYLVLWVVRVWDTGKIVKLSYDLKTLLPASLLLTAEAVLVTLDLNKPLTYAVAGAITLAIVLLHLKTLLSLAAFALKLVKKVLKRG